MRQLLAFLLFVVLSNSGHSQIVARLYYNNQWRLTTRESSTYFRVAIIDTTQIIFLGEVKDYDKDGKIAMQGSYKNGKKEGLFTFYYPNGQIESEGSFVSNYRWDVWKYYYSDGKIKQELSFHAFGSGEVVSYNFPDGTPSVIKGTGFWHEEYYDPGPDQIVINEGNLKENIKDGIWMCKLPNGQNIFEQHFKKGRFIRRIDFDGNGKRMTEVHEEIMNTLLVPYKFEITERFILADASYRSLYPFLEIKSNRIGGTQAQHQQDSSSLPIVGVMPVPVCGMQKYMETISKIQRYPISAKRNQIEGVVFVKFKVNADSSVTDLKVLKGIGAGCDEEAIRTIIEVHKLCRWLPGTMEGKPVTVGMTIPIKFRISKAVR